MLKKNVIKMNKKSKMVTITAILLLSLFIIAPAIAAPTLPAAFYGTVKINNANVPAGYTITVEINNVQKGTITTTRTEAVARSAASACFSRVIRSARV